MTIQQSVGTSWKDTSSSMMFLLWRAASCCLQGARLCSRTLDTWAVMAFRVGGPGTLRGIEPNARRGGGRLYKWTEGMVGRLDGAVLATGLSYHDVPWRVQGLERRRDWGLGIVSQYLTQWGLFQRLVLGNSTYVVPSPVWSNFGKVNISGASSTMTASDRRWYVTYHIGQ